MIGYLSGLVKYFHSGTVIVDVHGVGYLVSVPSNLHFNEQTNIELYIHTHIREDAFDLFGFSDRKTYEFFQQLLTVNGVGPKSALSIISQTSIDQIYQAITTSNLAFFTNIKGLGKKTAQKLIIELKTKLTNTQVDLSQLETNPDLVDALVALGYNKTQINQVIGNINLQEDLKVQIKTALKLLK